MDKFDIKRFNGIFYVISVLLLLFITFKIMLFLLPFVLAMIIVWLVKPVISFMDKKIRLNSKFIKSFILLLFYIIMGGIIAWVIFRIVLEGYKFSYYVIQNQTVIINNIQKIGESINESVKFLPKNVIFYINNLFEKIFSTGTKSLFTVFSLSFTAIKKFPNVLIFLFVMMLSSFVVINDEQNILKFLSKQFPKMWLEKFDEIKNGVFVMLFVYIKAQLILIFLCFFELLIGLSIINLFVSKIEYILLFAFIICFLEALPMIGAGIIIFPWIIISLINQNYMLAVALLVLEIVVVAARQFLEPKLISSGAKNHPLVTLIAMYSGFKFFGIIGFLIGPVILSIIKIVFYEEIEYGFFKFLIAEKKNEENN